MKGTLFWGAEFVNDDVTAASRRMIYLAESKQSVPVRLVNANSIAAADIDEGYREVIASPGINYADGLPLAACLSLINWRHRRRRQSRVRGPSLFEKTLSEAEDTDVSHLFFGGSELTIAGLERTILEKFPRLKIAAFVSPPIAETDELVDLAKQAHLQHGGDIVWVGLGQPKQDMVAYHLAGEVSRPCVGVGAAFDFLAGTVKSAPKWMQVVGMEWLYRLRQEPRRLWRRYTLGNLRFLKVAGGEIRRTAVSAGEQTSEKYVPRP